MTPPKHARRIKLIKPGLQLRLIAVFLGLSAISLFLQGTLLMVWLERIAQRLPQDGEVLTALAPQMVAQILGVTVVVLLPITTIVGILITFRIAGPLHRFENFLREVVAGRQIGPCHLRDGDELRELCTLINEATEPVRRRVARPAALAETDNGPLAA